MPLRMSLRMPRKQSLPHHHSNPSNGLFATHAHASAPAAKPAPKPAHMPMPKPAPKLKPAPAPKPKSKPAPAPKPKHAKLKEEHIHKAEVAKHKAEDHKAEVGKLERAKEAAKVLASGGKMAVGGLSATVKGVVPLVSAVGDLGKTSGRAVGETVGSFAAASGGARL